MKKIAMRICAGLLAVLLTALCGGCKGDREMELTVMSQNLLVDSNEDDENNIFYRADRFIALLETYQPDIAGLQEFTPSWDALIYEYLEEKGYGIAMQYRSSSDREATPIIYNANRLELIEEKHFWLSDTPEEESPSWDDGDGRRCRIVTTCVFEDKETGIRFAHLNTHFGLTAYSQENSGQMINEYVQEHYADMPVFVTGDFNTTEGSTPYNNIIANDVLFNSQYLAEEFGNVTGTFNGLEDGESSTVIDFIFVSAAVTPVYYSVLTDKPDGKFVSDHYAVLTKNIIRS